MVREWLACPIVVGGLLLVHVFSSVKLHITEFRYYQLLLYFEGVLCDMVFDFFVSNMSNFPRKKNKRNFNAVWSTPPVLVLLVFLLLSVFGIIFWRAHWSCCWGPPKTHFQYNAARTMTAQQSTLPYRTSDACWTVKHTYVTMRCGTSWAGFTVPEKTSIVQQRAGPAQ